MERRAILDALARCRGKVYGPGGAAAVLGLKPTTLYGKMRKTDLGPATRRITSLTVIRYSNHVWSAPSPSPHLPRLSSASLSVSVP